MMIKITVAKKGITKTKARKFSKLVKEAMIAACKLWRDNYMPKHFNKGASRKYRYRKRNPQYQRYKNRRGIGPLQFTGRARRKIEADRREPKGTNKKVTLRIRGVGFFNRTWKKGQKTMAEELTTVKKDERNRLLEIIDERVQRSITAATQLEKKVYRPR